MVEELYEKTLNRFKTFHIESYLPAFRTCNAGAIEDVLNTNGSAYYQLSACLVDVLKPNQVIELGGAMGVWSLMVLQTLPKDSKLYSITLPENGLEFLYIIDTYPNFYPIVGDDLDKKNWEGVDLAKTDIWFFDSEHTEKQLRAELYLYTPFFKKGAVLLFDDIRLPELWPVWEKLPYDKLEITNPAHYSGFGMAVV